MFPEPIVYILILNWKNYQQTARCIQACRELIYSNFKIVIIDNGSPNNSEIYLRQSFSEIEFIQNKKNLGYAGGNNPGILIALNNKADYIWILNPDVEVENDSLTKLVNLLSQDSKIGICGPRIINGKAPNSFHFDGLSIDSLDGWQSSFNIITPTIHNNQDSVKDVDCVSGCSMLVRSSLFYSIGLLREEFFLYYEDVDFCFRTRAAGFRTIIFPKVNVYHSKDKLIRLDSVGFFNERSRHIFNKIYNNKSSPQKIFTKYHRVLICEAVKNLKIINFTELIAKILLGSFFSMFVKIRNISRYKNNL